MICGISERAYSLHVVRQIRSEHLNVYLCAWSAT